MHIELYTVGGFNHLEKYESQWEGLQYPIYYQKMKIIFQTTNQIYYLHITWEIPTIPRPTRPTGHLHRAPSVGGDIYY
jgi:hypothetical protein